MASELKEAVMPSKSKEALGEEYYLAQDQYNQFMFAYDNGHKQWLETSERCDRFYQGEQWSDQDRSTLEAEGRPALTINTILPTVNVVLGEQSARRMDIQYKARRNGTEESANALTKLAMSVADANSFAWTESMVFADGLIQDRGFYDVRMDWSNSYDEGDAKIIDLDPADVVIDPEAKQYDPSTWKRVFVSRWLSLDDIDERYGVEVGKKLHTLLDTGEDFGKDSLKRQDSRFGTTSHGPQASDTEENKRIKRVVRVIEQQFYKNVRIHCLVDPNSGEEKKLPPGTSRSEATQLATQYNTYLVSKTEQRVRWRITADRYVIHDDWSPYRTFTVIPYFPYFRRGKPFGMVRNLLSPQEQFNKLSSQELHIVNSTANSGYIVEKGALHGMTADDLRSQGSKSGIVIEANPGRKDGIEKIKPNSIPTGIDRISQKAQINIKEISGITDAMLGMESAEVSGVALESKEKRGQIQIQVPLDNLSRTRNLLARKLLELFQDFYTEQRIIQITNDLEPGQPREELVINQPMSDGSVENDITMGEYDIVIGTMPTRDAFNDTQFAEALNLRNVGIQIPDYRVVQYSHLSHKEAIADEIRQLTGMGDVPPEVQEQQQRAAEAELANAEAEVEKKRAQVDQLRSQAELNLTKADDIDREDERQLRTLEQKHAESERGNQLRRDLATLSAINKLDNTELSGRLTKARGTSDGHSN